VLRSSIPDNSAGNNAKKNSPFFLASFFIAALCSLPIYLYRLQELGFFRSKRIRLTRNLAIYFHPKEELFMLVKYKKVFEKIAMGLLSFMPAGRELSDLQEMMKQYEENPDRQLYLWKREEDFVGVIGIEVQELTFTVHHISVNPSFRGEGIGHIMVQKVQELQEPRAMQASAGTKEFLEKCWESTYSV